MDQHTVRPHRNGMSAIVATKADGTFDASASQHQHPGVVTAAHLKPAIATLNEARIAADKLAHPDCDGGCAPWPAV